MAYTNPSVADFQSYFNRDFPYGTDVATSVTDTDISKAFQQTNYAINTAFFTDQASYNIGYYLLSAHFLTMNLRASSQGINGQFNFLQQSKGVDGVSESFAIPDSILADPILSVYTKTNYGAQYIIMILPYLRGAMYTVAGTTQP